jgi:hypothetical protein
VRISGKEIDLSHRRGEGPGGLDRVEAEEEPVLPRDRSDGGDVETVAGEEMTGGEGEELRAGRDRLAHQFRGDRADLMRLEVDDADSESLELLPRVDIGRVVVEVSDDLVAGLPVEPVRDETETETGRAEQGKFLRSSAEEPGRGTADAIHAFEEDLAVVELAGGRRSVEGLHRFDRGLGHRSDRRMREEDPVAAGGKRGAPGRFVVQEGFKIDHGDRFHRKGPRVH